MERYVTDRLYAAMEEAGYAILSSEFGFHLGRAKAMLEKLKPTDEELEALPAASVEAFEIWGKADSYKVLTELRRKGGRERWVSEDQRSHEPSFYEKETASRDRARSPIWYASVYEADFDAVKAWVDEGLSHPEIERRLHADGRAEVA